MRPRFSDGERIKQAAMQNWKSGMTTIKRWWVDKYRLPPNHPLFTECSISEWTQEMHEDLLARKAEIEADLEDARGDTEPLMRQLAAVNKALGDKEAIGEDDLIDEWERELEMGRVPDLDAMPGG